MGRYFLPLLLLLLAFALPLPVGAEEAAPPEMVPQLGNNTGCTYLTYTPDGTRLAATGFDGTILIWNPLTCLIEYRITAPPDIIFPKPSISSNNDWLLLSQGGNALLWSLRAGRAYREVGTLFPAAFRYTFHHDGAHLWAWCSEQGNRDTAQRGAQTAEATCALQLLDIATLRTERTIPHLRGRLLAISPDDTRAVTAIYTPASSVIPTPDQLNDYWKQGSSTLTLWNLDTGAALQHYTGYSGLVNENSNPPGYCFSTDGRYFAAHSDMNRADPIQVWDTRTGALVRLCPLPANWAASPALAFTGNNTQLTAAGDEFATWSLADIRPPSTLPQAFGKNGPAVAFHPDGKTCWATSHTSNKYYACYNLVTQKVIDWRLAPGIQLDIPTMLAAQPGGNLLANIRKGNAIPLWDLAQGRVRHWLSLPTGYSANTGMFTPDGKQLLIAVNGAGVYAERSGILCYDAASGELLRAINAPAGKAIADFARSADGKRMILVNSSGQVWAADADTRDAPMRLLCTLAQSNTQIALTADGTRLITVGTNSVSNQAHFVTTLVDLATALPRIMTTSDIPGQFCLLSMSPDERYLATVYFSSNPKSGASPRIAFTVLVRRMDTGQEIWQKEVNDTALLRLLDRERINRQTLVFTPDSRMLLLPSSQQSYTFFDAATGKELGTSLATIGVPWSFSCLGQGPATRLVIANTDGTLTVWKLSDVLGKPNPTPLATLMAHPDGRWLATTPAGYYDCSLEAANAMVWRVGDRVFPFDSFAAIFQRPDVLRKSLAGEDIATVPQLDVGQLPPTVSFTSPAYGTEIGQETTAPVTFGVKAGAPIARVECTVNGQPLPPVLANQLAISTPTKQEDVYTLNLPLPIGEPRIRIRAVAYDSRGLKSAPAELALFRPGAQAQPGTLYLLAVGINRYPKLPDAAQLVFAAPDAAAFADMLQRQRGPQPYNAVRVALQTDEKASLATLKLALRQVKDLATENDTVLIYISGHGLRDDAGNYYFPTYDADLRDLPGTALAWQDFQAALREMRAKQLLVLADTCQSGGILGKSTGSADLLADKLNRLAHRMVFTASQGEESSLEKPEWGHGAFTLALLEALGGKADENTDGWLSYQELATFVRARVVELTKGRQHPLFPFIDQFDPNAILARVAPAARK